MTNGSTPTHGWRGAFALALLTGWAFAGTAPAQGPPDDPSLRLPREWFLVNAGTSDVLNGPRSPRLRLFRIPFGYLHDAGEADTGDPTWTGEDDGRVQVSMGSDNPYLDFRRPGDPGGVGYFKVQTLVPVFGTTTTELSLGLQAVTPAGPESDGLADGATVLSPTLVWFQDLGGFAIQGFVGQHLPATGRTGDPLQRGWLYGVAIHQPLPSLTGQSSGNLHVFVEALGRQRRDFMTGPRPPAGWELLPGLHWRVSDSCWMSGGVILPLGATRFDPNQWQLTCRWQY